MEGPAWRRSTWRRAQPSRHSSSRSSDRWRPTTRRDGGSTRRIERETAGEPECLLFTDQMGVANHEVNAFQRVADVAICQKRNSEGFGLVVAETLFEGHRDDRQAGRRSRSNWRTGSQLLLRRPGRSRSSSHARPSYWENPVLARGLVRPGATHVRDRFLLPRLLRDQSPSCGGVAG